MLHRWDPHPSWKLLTQDVLVFQVIDKMSCQKCDAYEALSGTATYLALFTYQPAEPAPFLGSDPVLLFLRVCTLLFAVW